MKRGRGFSSRHQKVVGQSSLIQFCLSVWGSALPLSSFTSFTFTAPRATSAPPRCCFGCCTIWGVCRNSRGDLPSSPNITKSSQLPARTEQGTLIIIPCTLIIIRIHFICNQILCLLQHCNKGSVWTPSWGGSNSVVAVSFTLLLKNFRVFKVVFAANHRNQSFLGRESPGLPRLLQKQSCLVAP